jgi:hypothetical protein
MDDSKSETKVNHGECAVIHNIFHVMYGKREYYVTKENHGQWVVIRFIFYVIYENKEHGVMDNESI